MAPPPPPPASSPEGLVDEASVESFPASDAPPWTAAHLGAPSARPCVAEHGPELRGMLRADVEKIARVALLAESDEEARRIAMEDLVARGLLEAGLAVTREPVDGRSSLHIVDAEVTGAQPGAEPLAVTAHYDVPGVSGLAVLLSLARELAPVRLARTTHLVALPRGGASAYVQGRGRTRPPRVLLALADVGLPRRRRGDGLVFIGNWASRGLVRAARRAFLVASRLPARTMALPSWVPGPALAEEADMLRVPWPAVVVSDHGPWRAHAPGRDGWLAVDVDRMAAAVPGLVSVVMRLAGGRA